MFLPLNIKSMICFQPIHIDFVSVPIIPLKEMRVVLSSRTVIKKMAGRVTREVLSHSSLRRIVLSRINLIHLFLSRQKYILFLGTFSSFFCLFFSWSWCVVRVWSMSKDIVECFSFWPQAFCFSWRTRFFISFHFSVLPSLFFILFFSSTFFDNHSKWNLPILNGQPCGNGNSMSYYHIQRMQWSVDEYASKGPNDGMNHEEYQKWIDVAMEL